MAIADMAKNIKIFSSIASEGIKNAVSDGVAWPVARHLYSHFCSFVILCTSTHRNQLINDNGRLLFIL